MNENVSLAESPIDDEELTKTAVCSENDGEVDTLELFVFETLKVEKESEEKKVKESDQKVEVASIVSFGPDGGIDGNEPSRENNPLNAEEER